MTNPKDMVEVTPEDREAALPVMFWLYNDPGIDRDVYTRHFMEGDSDDHLVVQAFARHRLTAQAQGGDVEKQSFQTRVQPWMMACFGPEISADKLERSDRFMEEALELVQAGDYPKELAIALADYVYGRPQGDINQEVGGVMVTLAAHCLAHGVDMHEAAETELARIWTKVEQIRAKQAAKPTGSALPIAHFTPAELPGDALREDQKTALVNAARILDYMAGEGAGMTPPGEDTLWADDACLAIMKAFGFEDAETFDAGVRAALATKENGNSRN